MSKTYRPWKIDQPLLLPVTVQEFVGDDHPARFVVELVVDHLELGEIEAAYASVRSGDDDGAAAPRLLQRHLLFAAHRQGVARTRRLHEHRLSRCPGLPDDQRLPQAHLKALAGLFTQVLQR
jgi:hypothetical protein